jgi:hypothetical protein
MLSTGKFLKSIEARIYSTMISDIFRVCFDVMYSGEYNVFNVTLRVYPHRGQAEKLARPRWESNLRPLEASCGISELSLVSSIPHTNVFYDHDPTFQPTRCGYTLRVTSKTQ